MGLKRFCWLGLLVIFLQGIALADEPLSAIKIAGVDPRFRVAQDYFAGLLQKALIRGANGRPVPPLLEQQLMEQERATQELIRGRLLDVYWMGTNSFRETHLRAIKIPLTRGLLSYRRFIIDQAAAEKFRAINNIDQLKQLIACQGRGWPDTLILRASGLRVREIIDVDHIYQGLSSGVCDYYPRGYFEVLSELNTFGTKYPRLTSEDNILLHYPFAIYYFVHRDNKELADWISQGLERMIDSGEFMEFMQAQALTSMVFPLNFGTKWRIFELNNTDLPPDTDYQNPRYWFQSADFGVRPANFPVKLP